ncbi:MAG: hypothetical protein C4519_00765 [Desulfobacteraceae bacterium]|nr:MAG: hypothetical protein C4519_00765 [Desulfobacteraceae bacterium]
MNRKILYGAMALLLVFSSGSLVSAAETDRGQRSEEGQMTDDNRTTDQNRMTDRDRTDGTTGGAMQSQEQSAGGDTDRAEMTETRQDAEEAAHNAATVLQEFTGEQGSIPASVLEQAQGIVVIPNVIKAGLIAGGRFGRGVLLAKNQDQWSLPVIVNIGGASLGAQIGVEQSDLIMVFRNPQAVEKLLADNEFTLGVDASVAAGSAGAKAEGMITKADVITYQRSKGLFAGVALTGGVLDVDEKAMAAFYRTDEPSVRAYYGEDDAQLARKVLNSSGQQEQQAGQIAPASAKNLQAVMNQITSTNR